MKEKLTKKQLQYLSIIAKREPISRYELGNLVYPNMRGLSMAAARSGVSKIFRTLESKGLIVEADLNVYGKYSLTEKGREIITK